MTTAPTPPRLGRAKAAAVAAAALATTTALTFGATAVASEVVLADRDAAVSTQTAQQRDVELAAVAGLYGVGPIFWVADALGITPESVTMALVNQLDNAEITAAVQKLFVLLGAVVDVDAPGPLPSDVYNSVNGLEYSGDLILGLARDAIRKVPLVGDEILDSHLGLDIVAKAVNRIFPGAGVTAGTTVDQALQAIVRVTPVLNQRRAIILSESLGGLTTSLAYRDMIEAVTSNSSDWGEGVTGQWLIFINNPSRPGGGLFALASPFTNLLGLNLSTPAGGSYTNADANNGQMTKILNTSVLDVTWAYNAFSDAPTTINPLSWANAAAGSMFLTYLIPDGLNPANTNLGGQLPILLEALLNGGIVMLDPTGGQGLNAVSQWTELVKLVDDIPVFGDGIAGALRKLADTVKLPAGESFFVTYDSGNLPILEPLDFLPRMLGLAGVDVPQPFVNSIEDALRLAVNTGYQDVNVADLERTYDEGGEQAVLWHSALTPTQQVDAAWKITNVLVNDIQANLLNPVAWTPSIAGQPGFNDAAESVIQNAVFMAVSNLLNEGVDVAQGLSNDGFKAVREAVKPALSFADDANSKIEGGIDDIMQVDKLSPAPAPSADPNESVDLSGLESSGLSTTTLAGARMAPEEQSGALDEALQKTGISKVSDVLGGAADNVPKGAKSVATLLKKQQTDLRDNVDKQVAKGQSSLTKRSNELKGIGSSLSKGEVGDVAEGAGTFVKDRVERLGKDIRNGVNKVAGKDRQDNKPNADQPAA